MSQEISIFDGHIPINLETIAEIRETVDRLTDYLALRRQLEARIAEISEDYRKLSEAEQANILDRNRDREGVSIVVRSLIDRGEHALASDIMINFISRAPNHSDPIIKSIRDRLELNPLRVVTKD